MSLSSLHTFKKAWGYHGRLPTKVASGVETQSEPSGCDGTLQSASAQAIPFVF